MKQIILFILLLFFGYGKSYYKVYIQKGLSDKGVLIWKTNVIIRHFRANRIYLLNPDCVIELRTNLPAKEPGRCYWMGTNERPKPVIIEVKDNNDVYIAHEFGHFLGYFDNKIYGSIMYPRTDITNKELLWFIEFRKLWLSNQ